MTTVREHVSGGAKPTTLASGILAGAATLTVPAGGLATWPDGSVGRIPVVVARGQADEEHLYATAVAGDALTGLVRGQDNTVDQPHTAGVTVEHGLFATHIDAPNAFLSLPQAKGDLAVATAADNWSRLAAGTNGQVLVYDATTPTGFRPTSTLAGLTFTTAILTAPTMADFTNAAHDHNDADDGGNIPTSAVTGLAAALAATVNTAGAQTVAGVKTFSSAPVVPAAAFPEAAVANLTTDLAAKAADSAVVHNTGAETVAGAKTFSSKPVLPAGATVAGNFVLSREFHNTVATVTPSGQHFHVGDYSGTTDGSGYLVVPISTGGADLSVSRAWVQSTQPSSGGNAGYPVVVDAALNSFTIRYIGVAGSMNGLAVAGSYIACGQA